MKKKIVLGVAGLIAALAVAPGPSRAQELYDCVIEPSMTLEIGSAVEGIIEEVMVSRGDVVEAEQIVARLESMAEEAALRSAEERASSNAAIEMAESQVALLTKDAERATTLSSGQFVAETVLDRTLSELDQARLRLRQAKEEKFLAGLDKMLVEARLARRVIKTPITGVVINRMIGPGEYVYSQAPIARIAQIDPLNVEVYLPTTLYPEVRIGDFLTVRPAAPVGGSYEAEVTVVDQVFDAASDTFGVRLTLDNPERKLPAGIDCQIEIP